MNGKLTRVRRKRLCGSFLSDLSDRNRIIPEQSRQKEGKGPEQTHPYSCVNSTGPATHTHFKKINKHIFVAFQMFPV